MQKTKKAYTDSRTRRNLSLVSSELQDVQRIMVSNIDDVLQRGVALKGKSNLSHTRAITPKRVMSSGIHLRGLAPGQPSYEETSRQWRDVGNTVCDLIGRGIGLRPPHRKRYVFNHYAASPLIIIGLQIRFIGVNGNFLNCSLKLAKFKCFCATCTMTSKV